VLIQAIGMSRSKHTFFTNMSQDVPSFVRHWPSTQKRDLEVIMGEATRRRGEDAAGDELRRGGRNSAWATQNAKDSIDAMLLKWPAFPC